MQMSLYRNEPWLTGVKADKFVLAAGGAAVEDALGMNLKIVCITGKFLGLEQLNMWHYYANDDADSLWLCPDACA